LRSIRLSDAWFAKRLIGKYGWSIGQPSSRRGLLVYRTEPKARSFSSAPMHIDVHIRHIRSLLHMHNLTVGKPTSRERLVVKTNQLETRSMAETIERVFIQPVVEARPAQPIANHSTTHINHVQSQQISNTDQHISNQKQHSEFLTLMNQYPVYQANTIRTDQHNWMNEANHWIRNQSWWRSITTQHLISHEHISNYSLSRQLSRTPSLHNRAIPSVNERYSRTSSLNANRHSSVDSSQLVIHNHASATTNLVDQRAVVTNVKVVQAELTNQITRSVRFTQQRVNAISLHHTTNRYSAASSNQTTKISLHKHWIASSSLSNQQHHITLTNITKLGAIINHRNELRINSNGQPHTPMQPITNRPQTSSRPAVIRVTQRDVEQERTGRIEARRRQPALEEQATQQALEQQTDRNLGQRAAYLTPVQQQVIGQRDVLQQNAQQMVVRVNTAQLNVAREHRVQRSLAAHDASLRSTLRQHVEVKDSGQLHAVRRKRSEQYATEQLVTLQHLVRHRAAEQHVTQHNVSRRTEAEQNVIEHAVIQQQVTRQQIVRRSLLKHHVKLQRTLRQHVEAKNVTALHTFRRNVAEQRTTERQVVQHVVRRNLLKHHVKLQKMLRQHVKQENVTTLHAFRRNVVERRAIERQVVQHVSRRSLLKHYEKLQKTLSQHVKQENVTTLHAFRRSTMERRLTERNAAAQHVVRRHITEQNVTQQQVRRRNTVEQIMTEQQATQENVVRQHINTHRMISRSQQRSLVWMKRIGNQQNMTLVSHQRTAAKERIVLQTDSLATTIVSDRAVPLVLSAKRTNQAANRSPVVSRESAQRQAIRLDVPVKKTMGQRVDEPAIQSLQHAIKTVEHELNQAKETWAKPNLDMNRLADQMFKEFSKRIRHEQQRRGM
jgi:hypothetical protein